MTSLLDQLIAEAGRIILGKERILRLSLAYMLARGDLLIEDLPGVGKTTLAHLLADEINRAARSALLEAIEEREITVEGAGRPLPAPFVVIATQNPAYQIGTFPLTESQPDRFLMRVEMGYPEAQAERALLAAEDHRDLLAQPQSLIEPKQLLGAITWLLLRQDQVPQDPLQKLYLRHCARLARRGPSTLT